MFRLLSGVSTNLGLSNHITFRPFSSRVPVSLTYVKLEKEKSTKVTPYDVDIVLKRLHDSISDNYHSYV